MSGSDWLVAASGPAGGIALAAMVVSYVRYACRKRDEFEKLAVDHGQCELTDVRSSVFAPNELVATLCLTHDVQLGPEVWQRKVDRELEELGKPAVREVYVTIEPMVAAIKGRLEDDLSNWQPAEVPRQDDPRYYSPMRSWSADDFRRWDWRPSFKQSNFDHGEQRYVLPFYRQRRPEDKPSVYKLPFHSEAAAQGWWRSAVPYAKYEEQRRAIKRFKR